MPKIVNFEHPAGDGRLLMGGACHRDHNDPENGVIRDHAHDVWTIRRAHNLDFSQGVAGGELPHGEKSSFLEDSADHTVSPKDADDTTNDWTRRTTPTAPTTRARPKRSCWPRSTNSKPSSPSWSPASPRPETASLET